MNNVANYVAKLYEKQGKYDEAKLLYMDFLEQYQVILGLEHPNTLNTMNKLAELYEKQGKYDEAEQLYKMREMYLKRTSVDVEDMQTPSFPRASYVIL